MSKSFLRDEEKSSLRDWTVVQEKGGGALPPLPQLLQERNPLTTGNPQLGASLGAETLREHLLSDGDCRSITGEKELPNVQPVALDGELSCLGHL